MEDVIIPMRDRDNERYHCGEPMQRLMTIPLAAIMKKTSVDMARDSLNSKDTGYMKPEHKAAAAQGLENQPKAFY